MVALTGIEEFMRSMSPVSSNQSPLEALTFDDARKRRLDALKARRRDLTDAPAMEELLSAPIPASRPGPQPVAPVAKDQVLAVAAAKPKAFAAVPQQVVSLMQGNSAKAQDMRRLVKENAAKLMQILTKTPADGQGLLPGTPFTMTGIQRLSQLLHQRAGQQGAPGRKIAATALQLLREPDPSKPSIQGLSASRIQALWHRAEPMFRKGGAQPAAFGGGASRRGAGPRLPH